MENEDEESSRDNDAPPALRRSFEGAPSTPSQEIPESNNTLLREWEASPPVAPAVVVADRVSSSGSAYPVATFVQNLVRTGMDQFGSTSNDQAHNDDPYSVRSEADLEAIQSQELGGRAVLPALSARTMNDVLDDHDVEYCLVDGDLLELPRTQSREQDLMESRLRDCEQQPGRMRRGVRKISKFFKRVRRGTTESSAVSSSLATQTISEVSDVVSTTTSRVSNNNTAANNNAATNSNNNNNAKSPKRRKERRRRGWARQRQDSHDSVGETATPPPASLEFAVTGLENPRQSLVSGHSGLQSFIRHSQTNGQQTSLRELQDNDPLSGGRGSVHADFLGTADQIASLDAGLLPADVAAVAFVDETDDLSYWKKDDGSVVASVLPRDADYKVDKADAPDVESMLMRAAQETTNDLDSPDLPLSLPRPGKMGGSIVPLSLARKSDVDADARVHNDMLKIVMVASQGVPKSWLARSLRGSQKRPRKRATLGVDVHSWTPESLLETTDDNDNDEEESEPTKFMIWDVQGATGCPEDSANFGAHPGTQSLFFSEHSLYILVSDLACDNYKTNPKSHIDHDMDDDEYDDDGEVDPFVVEEATRKANRALMADYSHRMLLWIDAIASRGTKSAVLPVAVVPPEMSPEEVKRRCSVLQSALMEHVEKLKSEAPAPKLLSGADDQILCVHLETGDGINRLRETIYSIGNDPSHSVFEHVGTDVPQGTVQVLEYIRRFKEQHKLILLDHLVGALEGVLDLETIVTCLRFLASVGEILYFGNECDEVLSRYIVLSRKWLVSALSCILRNDLKRELRETRRFMNMQCIYSQYQFAEHEIITALASGHMASCPLLSDSDAKMLWQSMSFMREASDHYAQLSETSTSTPTMFHFLERLLVHGGIFLPLGAEDSSTASLDKTSEVFFVPSLLAQADPREVWTYKSSESWMATLCHSWLFRDGVPPNLMEQLTVNILRDLYKFSRQFHGETRRGDQLSRAQTVPLSRISMDNVLGEYDEDVLGRVKIHQIVCWNASLLVKIGTVFADQESGELRESFVEVFVAIVDQSDDHCVASDAMRLNMQRVVVSGKGQIGNHGRKIWKGGYSVVLQSVKNSLAKFSNVDAQVVCPECLSRSNPQIASTWSWDSVFALASGGGSIVRCMRGHRLDSNFLCGTVAKRKQAPVADTAERKGSRPISDLLPSVVVVGLWDVHGKCIRSVGSGFIVDKKIGLVVTAGHVLFTMKGGRDFGRSYFGIPDAKVVIGVIPDGGHTAVFRYFGQIVYDDINNVDACVVRITSRLEEDVDDAGSGCADQDVRMLALAEMEDEDLKPLKTTLRYELEEGVRILGFNQGGEGVLEKGKHVNRCADFARGYICRRFQAAIEDDDSSNSDSSHQSFSPREEIVVMCPTISGHSGGPCVNDDGKVVGILSRADPADRQRCYLVPSSELKGLIQNARRISRH